MSVSMRISSTAGCVFALVRSASASASALARRAFAPVARGRARRIVSSVSSMRSSVRSGARARSPGARAYALGSRVDDDANESNASHRARCAASFAAWTPDSVDPSIAD
jgi:hypothetical protein